LSALEVAAVCCAAAAIFSVAVFIWRDRLLTSLAEARMVAARRRRVTMIADVARPSRPTSFAEAVGANWTARSPFATDSDTWASSRIGAVTRELVARRRKTDARMRSAAIQT